MPLHTSEIIGRNADRLIKKYEHVPTIISFVTLFFGILIFAIPVFMDHLKRTQA
ncbi:Protein CBG19240 [Caenorhabditis briggsae]|nr:Protein CBG19240 [Caenorhabditis briggsae]CAP36525.1 Protein CBG19240 [Caenorhabditis briggsae]